MKKLVILGAGGHARDIMDVVDAINHIEPRFDLLGFIVDRQYGHPGEMVNAKPILGDFSWLDHHRDVLVVCGVGDAAVRREMVFRAAKAEVQFATLIHPQVISTRWNSFGSGAVIMGGCVLTNRVRIGHHVHVNIGCTISHDALLNDYATLSPGVHIAGNIVIGEGAYIGTGANIIEKMTIGRWSIVGAGSTIVRDVPDNTTVVGVPGKVIKERPEGWHLHDKPNP